MNIQQHLTCASTHQKLFLLCLFDKSGIMGQPWANAGHTVVCLDWEATEGYRNGIWYKRFDLRDISALLNYQKPPDCVISFPDCTHLAVSGSRHFNAKRRRCPTFQSDAMDLFRTGERISMRYNIPSFTENPVSVAATMYRKPDFYFHPYEYGGYLPTNDAHPTWPEYIAPRDAYPKKTSAWLLNGFSMPPKKPVAVSHGYSAQYSQLGGRSAKTKTIRSLTPRGLALAVFLHMAPVLLARKDAVRARLRGIVSI